MLLCIFVLCQVYFVWKLCLSPFFINMLNQLILQNGYAGKLVLVKCTTVYRFGFVMVDKTDALWRGMSVWFTLICVLDFNAIHISKVFYICDLQYKLYIQTCFIPQISKNIGITHFKFLGPRMVTWSKFHTENTQILGTTVQNLVTRGTWRPGFLLSCMQ